MLTMLQALAFVPALATALPGTLIIMLCTQLARQSMFAAKPAQGPQGFSHPFATPSAALMHSI